MSVSVQVAGVFEGRDDGGADGGQVGGPAAGAAGGGIFAEAHVADVMVRLAAAVARYRAYQGLREFRARLYGCLAARPDAAFEGAISGEHLPDMAVRTDLATF